MGNVTMLRTQYCLACGTATQYVSGHFVEERDPSAGEARRYSRMAALPDTSLPSLVEYEADEHVHACAACLSATERIDSTFETWLAAIVETPQMRLF